MTRGGEGVNGAHRHQRVLELADDPPALCEQGVRWWMRYLSGDASEWGAGGAAGEGGRVGTC